MNLLPLLVQAHDAASAAGEVIGVFLLVASLLACGFAVYLAVMFARVPFEVRTIRETLQRMEALAKSGSKAHVDSPPPTSPLPERSEASP